MPPRLGAASNSNGDHSENVEYSSRELKTGQLLLQDLLRAHSVFLLHHAASLSALFVRTQRGKFTAMLGRYWDLFLSTWNVMLHGNPACNVFGGIKVAASGELGVGVGEEDRGSGEREVLEGFVGRIEGLVDLVVSKFGEPAPETAGDQQSEAATGDPSTAAWLGTGDEPGAEDGAIFLGVGALSRHSLRDIFYWMEDMYTWGPAAYGVEESPTSTRIRTKRKRPRFSPVSNGTKAQLPESTNGATAQKPDGRGLTPASQPMTPADSNEGSDRSGMDRFVSYLKMGYGKHWSLGSSTSETAPQPAKADDAPTEGEPTPAPENTAEPAVEPDADPQPKGTDDSTGRFLIGLRGDVDDPGSDSLDSEDSGARTRTLLRTLTVELESEARNKPEEETTRDFGSGDHELRLTKSGRRKDSADPSSAFDSQDRNKTKRMRVVVYVSRPFVYTLLFENRTPSLAWESLYRSLHHQLAPLRKPLSVSTQYRPGRPDVGTVSSHIFDLVWDPQYNTVQSTIPNIPEPVAIYGQGLLGGPPQPLWSRIEAINTHMQILNMYAATRTNCDDLERTCKTRRGWWVVWTRLLETRGLSPVNEDEAGSTPALVSEDSKDSSNSEDTNRSASVESGGASDQVVRSQTSSDEVISSQNMTEDSNETPTLETQQPQPQPPSDRRKRRKPKVDKEIFLIRRAGEHRSARSVSSPLAEHGGGGWLDSSSRLAQGIGVDTKKYIEELLSLGR